MNRNFFLLPVLICFIQLFSSTIYSQKSELDSLLFEAVKTNKLDKVKSIVEKGVNLNVGDSLDATPLMWAVYKGDLNVVKFLVEKGADFTLKGTIRKYEDGEKTGYYGNLLGIAAGEGKLDILKYFIEDCGIDIEDKEYNRETGKANGWNAFQWGVSEGNLEIVKYLLNRGADIHVKDNKQNTLLHLATTKNHLKIAQLLNEKGLKLQAKEKFGNTPLHLAAFFNNKEIAQWLINNGANIESENKSGYTPLHWCAYKNSLEVAKLLIEKGAKLDAKDQNGETPLHKIVDDYSVDVAKLLIENGAQPNIQDDYGETPLHEIAARDGGKDLAKLLINNGVEVNVKDNNGETPLHHTALKDNLILAEYLIKNQALVNVKDDNDKTPIHWAINQGSKRVTQFLIENRAKINIKNVDGNSPLHIAAGKNYIELAKTLISNGADINSKNKYDLTPLGITVEEEFLDISKFFIEKGENYNIQLINKLLFISVKENKPDFVKYFINKGAEINNTDKKNNTPIYYAVKKDYLEIAQILINKNTISYTTDNLNESLLKIAKENNSINMAHLLIKNDIDFDINKDISKEFLFKATELNNHEMVGLLIEKGININARNYKDNTVLHIAASNNSYEVAKLLIKNDINVDVKNNDNETPLYLAAKNNCHRVGKLLITEGADVNVQESYSGKTPLYIAVSENSEEMVHILINNNAEIEIETNSGRTAIYWAFKNLDVAKLLIENGAKVNMGILKKLLIASAENNKPETFKYFLSNGPDIELKSEFLNKLLFKTPENKSYNLAKILIGYGADVNSSIKYNKPLLHKAIENDDFQMAKLFLINGANVNSKDGNGQTPLHYAVKMGKTNLIDLLIKEGANVNSTDKNKQTPLHYAAKQNNTTIADILIKHNADINAQDVNGNSPLMTRIKESDIMFGQSRSSINVAFANLLILKGANLNLTNNKGNTALHLALNIEEKDFNPLYTFPQNISHSIFLIKNGSKLNIRNNKGRTALFLALYSGKRELLNLLISEGAKVNMSDKKGQTPLHYALKSKSYKMTTLLLERDADINESGKQKKTPLHYTVESENIKLTQLLINKGADLNVKDAKNKTPLHYAVEKENKKLIQLLINNECNIDEKDRLNKTPLHYACEKNNITIAKQLIKKGANINAEDMNGESPLHKAIYKNYLNVAIYLIKQGTNTNISVKMADKTVPLIHWAMINDNNKVLQLLLKKNDLINLKDNNNRTPLNLASLRNNFIHTKILYKNGGRINTFDKHKANPLNYAVFNQNKSMVKFLIEKGAKINTKFTQKDSMFLEMVKKSNNLYFVKLAYLFEPDLNYKNEEGKTAIDIAKEQGKNEILNFLNNPNKLHVLSEIGFTEQAIEYLRENPNLLYSQDENGESLLHLAIENRDNDLVNFVLKRDKKERLVNIQDNEGRTPLYKAVLLNYYEIGKQLIHYGASPYSPDDKGYTPWFIAKAREDSKWPSILSKSKDEKQNVPLKPKLVLPGKSSKITKLSFSPEREYILSGAEDGKIKLWDINSGKKIRTFKGHSGAITSILFSSDGNYIFSSSKDNTIKLWDVFTGNEIKTFDAHENEVTSLDISPDGQKLISASKDQTVKIWNIKSGKELKAYNFSSEVLTVTYSPKGKYYAAGLYDEVLLWDLKRNEKTKSFRCVDIQPEKKMVKFFPGGKRILEIKQTRGEAIKWDISSGRRNQTYRGTPYPRNVSPNLKYLIGGTTFFKIKTKEKIKTIFDPDSPISANLLSSNGKYAVFGHYNGTISLWNTKSGEKIKRFKESTNNIASISLSKNGKILLAGTNKNNYKLNSTPFPQSFSVKIKPKGFIKSLNISSGTIISFNAYNNLITSVEISRDQQNALSVSDTGSIKLWNLSTGTNRNLFQKEKCNNIPSISYSTDQEYALAGIERNIKLIKLDTSIKGKVFDGHKNYVNEVTFTPNDKYFLSASTDKTIKLWKRSIDKPVKSFIGHSGSVNSLSVTNDGRYILSGSNDKLVKLWDTEIAGQKVKFSNKTFDGHTKAVYSVDFSPNDQLALSAAGDGLIKIWDIETEKCIQNIKGHTNGVKKAIFDPSGKFIFSIGFNPYFKGLKKKNNSPYTYNNNSYSKFNTTYDQTIKLWSAKTGKELATLMYVDSTDWVVTTPDGLFDASSERAMNKMHFVQGMEVIELEQLKDLYYEPHLLQKIMGYNDEPIREVESLKSLKLYPEIETLKLDKGKLKVELADQGGGIGKVKVFINGKEIAEDARLLDKKIEGNIDFRGAYKKENLELTIDIKDHSYLLPGESNIIKVIAYNGKNWLKSQEKEITYTPGKKKTQAPSELYAIVAGVSDYKGDNIDLRYASKDAGDFARTLKLTAGKLFGRDKTHITLLNTEDSASTYPTKEKIEKAFKNVASSAKSNDILLVYLAGHGTNYGGQDGDFYYMTSNAANFNLSIPALRKQNAISGEEFTEYFKDVAALKQVLIMDACHSGKYAENLMASREDVSSSVIRSYERMKDRTGMYILSGSAADAVSYETSVYGQGLLTYSLIFGMKGAALREGEFVDIVKLFQHSADYVPKLAENIGGVQKPQIRYPMGGQSFDIGRVTDKVQEKITLAEPKPLFLRSTFTPYQSFRDNLGLSELIDNKLRNYSASRDGSLVFVDATNYPKAYSLNGRYKEQENSLKATVELYKGKKKLKRFELEGSNKEKLVESLINKTLIIINKK